MEQFVINSAHFTILLSIVFVVGREVQLDVHRTHTAQLIHNLVYEVVGNEVKFLCDVDFQSIVIVLLEIFHWVLGYQ